MEARRLYKRMLQCESDELDLCSESRCLRAPSDQPRHDMRQRGGSGVVVLTPLTDWALCVCVDG